MRFQTFGLAALLTGLVSAVPLTPEQDPFYVPPAGYQNTAPGTILRSRRIATGAFGLIPNPVESWQLLYRTTAINGSAISEVTTVFKPALAQLDKFVSFQTAFDSSTMLCAPSYNYQLLANQTNAFVGLETLVVEGLLIQGYIVSSSDYEGPDAAFCPGHLEGMGVLDSMRAVSNFGKTLGLITSNPAIVGVGYSGGSIATGWAAQLQSTYAPELNVKGWASGGTPANLTGTFVYNNGGTYSGFLPASIDGLLKPSAYGAQLQPLFSSIVTPYGQSVLDYGNSHCVVDDLLNSTGVDLLSTNFQTLGSQLLWEPTFRNILLGKNTMGVNKTETPIAPYFLYHAGSDELIPYLNVSTLYNNWCANGVNVQFGTVQNGEHFATEAIGFLPMSTFVGQAFAGLVPTGCSKFNITPNLSTTALGLALKPVLSAIYSVLPLLIDADGGNLTALAQPIST